ncbi:hypothetical protein TMUPMC115_1270 [Tetragenococcus muriaticus PMC-11-5]|uniref:Uncharacterized protein n=1 Tax=Tetragenococcus muriaticus PMC-11-5 TaxID=1302649 RepID=A0A091C1B4_9ENTE|nr:hypothetical protein TMUPMC115_1270 [Tetragenococcus muriaticus PMC-11-5]
MEKFLTEEEVKEVIPNRYPILYIDFVDTIESGKKNHSNEKCNNQ